MLSVAFKLHVRPACDAKKLRFSSQSGPKFNTHFIKHQSQHEYGVVK